MQWGAAWGCKAHCMTMSRKTLHEWGPEEEGRTAAGLGELQLSLLYQLLQAPLPARKPARNPGCIEHTMPVSLT